MALLRWPLQLCHSGAIPAMLFLLRNPVNFYTYFETTKSCQASSKFRQKSSNFLQFSMFMANSAGGVSVLYPRCPVPSIFNACLVMAMVAAATPMKVGTEILRGWTEQIRPEGFTDSRVVSLTRSSSIFPLVNCRITMENHHCSWVNQLFRLGHFQVRKLLVYQRV